MKVGVSRVPAVAAKHGICGFIGRHGASLGIRLVFQHFLDEATFDGACTRSCTTEQ